MSGFKQLAYVCVMAGVAFALNPTGRYGRDSDLTLEERSRDGASPPAKPAEPMPPTACRSVEPVPEHADKYPRSGPHRVHNLTVTIFLAASGFGRERFFYFTKERSVIERVELVSLLTDSSPSVYVLDKEPKKPTLALTRKAKRRPLDEFERHALDAVRRGENLVWTREAPTRMFGVIVAGTACLECHTSAKEGDLLGAFTYYLNTPVDRLYDE